MASQDPLERAYYDLVGARAASGHAAIDGLWDQLRADFKAEGFGDLAGHMEQNAPAAAPSAHAMIQRLSAEIRSDFNQAGHPLRTATYAGAFPTGSFNAQAVLIPEGTLLLINTGLMVFIHKLVKILMHSVVFQNFETKEMSATGRLAQDIPHAELVLALAELAVAYMSTNAAWMHNTRHLPLPGGVRTLLLGMIVHSCEKFVLAHEYAHVTAGHLSATRTVRVHTPAGEIEFAAKRRIEEFQADRLALEVIMKSAEFNSDNPFSPRIAAAGVLLFFAAAELIERNAPKIEKIYGFTSLLDHPPTTDRREVLSNEITRLKGPGMIDMGSGFSSWLAGASGEVAALLEKAAP